MTTFHPSAGLLAGKTAIITGTAMGLGKAMARVFVREGAKVLAADLDPGNAAALADSSEFGAHLERIGVIQGGRLQQVREGGDRQLSLQLAAFEARSVYKGWWLGSDQVQAGLVLHSKSLPALAIDKSQRDTANADIGHGEANRDPPAESI